MSGPSKRNFELSQKKRALFEALLEKEGLDSTVSLRIPRRSMGQPLPLSFAQQRLWFLDQLEPGSIEYNLHEALRLVGPLDVSALHRSLNEIIRRHETLRTTFTSIQGDPTQVIAPELQLPLPVLNLEESTAVSKEEQLRQFATQDFNKPFDLEHGPLFRATLVRLTAQEHVLLLNMHHIISDGWSLGVFFKELATLYEDFTQGKPNSLPELPVQYADFSVWQRRWLSGDVLEQQLSYWKRQLGGAPQVLELSTDRPRPVVQTFRGLITARTLPKALLNSLAALSRKEGVTLFVLLLAAFDVLLSRYSGQEDVVVGSPIANRNRVEIEDLIGFFVNTLVLRTDLSGNPSFRELLKRVREVTLGAYSHQDLPFEKLVEELQPRRALSHSPLFQIMFVFQNAPMPPLRLGALEVAPFHVDSGTAKFDLTLFMAETDQGLHAGVEYNSDLFEATTMERFLGHLQSLLEAIVADPTERLSELPWMAATEREQILVEWNRTVAAYPRELTLQQLLEAQAARIPDAVGVAFEDQSLTYKQLNERANQLAHYLKKFGVGPEILVGLCVERSLEMMVALLGILKAGGAYVPLDPEFPRERLAFMLADSNAAILLTQRRLLPELPSHNAKILFLDAVWESIARESSENPPPSASPEHLAYVMYTSGSTGLPKGVEIPHRAVVNFLHSMQREPGMTKDDVLLAVTTLSFDIAGLELYLPLTVGARVVLAAREVMADGLRLAELLERSGATVMQATPATWRLLLMGGWNGNPKLKILCGGEALPLELARELLPRGASLWDLYGPTETTIWSTLCRVKPEDSFISIGRPIANTHVYLLDSHLQPVPIGVPGELHIGGDGLARGYLNQPELTAEKFIVSPFHPEARLYKTGDLARYRADGRLECLGRVDQQVKLRGFRIELGEIEAVLRRLEGVAEAVVVAREDSPGDQRLVAYLLADTQQELSFSQLRQALRAQLPDYMIPAAFVRLDLLPLTPNGKVDRKALPKPEGSRPNLEKSFQAPRTPVEQVISDIWTQIIGLERVGVEDNFFDLGGHSLLATRVISRLRETFHVELPLRRFFEAPTVDGLAEAILKDPAQQAQVEKRAEVILRLSQLSDHQVRAMLDKRGVAEGSSKVQ